MLSNAYHQRTDRILRKPSLVSHFISIPAALRVISCTRPRFSAPGRPTRPTRQAHHLIWLERRKVRGKKGKGKNTDRQTLLKANLKAELWVDCLYPNILHQAVNTNASRSSPVTVSRSFASSTARVVSIKSYMSDNMIGLTAYDSLSDVPESRVWFASKDLTPCRMHWNDFLIGQIIAECHNFPNMYDML